jgi:hypothetical protein
MRDKTMTLRLSEAERDLLRETARRLKVPVARAVREMAVAEAMRSLDALELDWAPGGEP